MRSTYLYLFLDFVSIFFPFAFSFYAKANFSKKWKHLWPSILITSVIFILWDIAFTQKGVWGFNPKYIIGIYFFGLPIEEILFFVCIPYACVFLYEALHHFIKKDWFGPVSSTITRVLCVTLFSLGLYNLSRWYTSVTFIAAFLFLVILQWKWKPSFLGRFYFSFLFMLIPFFIINGILTGSFISEPVVWYNADENLGLRIGTIPVEDIFYGMLLLLMNISLFENFQRRSADTRQRP